MGGLSAAGLDAVTIDAYGTLVTLVDPVPALTAALAERGIERDREAIVAGFRTEAAHYSSHSWEGHDEPGLRRLQRDCAKVFLAALNAEIDADEFAPVYAGAMQFDVLPGVTEGLLRLRGLGLDLAVVGNWDLTLRARLDETGLAPFFHAVLHAAHKPKPDGLLAALSQLGVEPPRALHIGDDEVDEQAARAAGMHFAPAPFAAAVATLT
jgi:FMN phosphatase YigB (HAD superfamily)